MQQDTRKDKVMWKVQIIESEHGWGQRVDEVREFKTFDQANEFASEFNAKNNLPQVPDWYMYATKPYKG